MNDSQRIEELLHYFRMEQKEFAEMCGILPDTISNIKRCKQGISKKVLNKILLAFPTVNRYWLLDGEGEMLKSSTEQSIVGNNNIQGGDNYMVGSNNNDVPDLVKVLLAEKDKLLYEKDERIKEKDERIEELKEIIRELKSK